ncbi:MAG TPA: division/cell wall cluster transcriptional repressor MraZ [Alphaproteobacteria bacterium]
MSTHTNKVDAKGRVSVPAQFRTALQNISSEQNGFVVFPSSTHQALEGFSWGMMDELSRRLDQFPIFSSPQDDLAAAIFSNATPMNYDETGRILLPKDLLAHAKISDTALFVGLGNKFQIWQPELFADRQREAISHVQKQGLNLPPVPSRLGDAQ